MRSILLHHTENHALRSYTPRSYERRVSIALYTVRCKAMVSVALHHHALASQ
jgi:hypothetical protein